MGLQLDLKNWVKLEILLNRATNVLRQLFFHRWEFVHHGREWVNSETTGQEFITGLGNSVYERVNEIEQQHLRSGDVTQWDLTTVAHVLTMTHFSKNEKRNTNFGKQVKEENDKIRRLIVVRNLIVHHPTKIILDDAFNHLWDEVAKLLMGLGDSTTELNKLKQRSFARMLADTNEIKDKCRNNYVEITTFKGNSRTNTTLKNDTGLKKPSARNNLKARAKSYGNLTLAHTEHRNDDSSERDTRNKKTSPRPLMSVDIKMSKSVNGQHRDQTSKQPTNNKKKCSQQEPNKLSSSIGVPFAESFANNGSNGIITLNDVQQNDNLATKVMKDVPERVSQNKRQETLPSPSLAPNHLDSWEITRQQRLRNLGRDNRRPAAFLTEIHPEVDVLSKDHVVQMTMNEKGSVTEGAAVKTSSSSVLTRDNIETFLRYDPKLIKKYASKGSLTASIMQNAVEHALQALSVFITLDNWKSKGNVQRFLGESFVTYLAQAIRTEETVMNFPSSLKERMIVHVRQMLEAEMNSESQVDIDAKCCFAYLSMDSLEEIIAFLKGCSLKYKNEPCFHHRCGRLLGMLGRFEDGLSELNAALVLSQHRNCDLVYDRATMLRFIGCIKTDFNVVILAYNGFLKWAPADHRKVPESYYAMATIEIQKREIFKQEAGHLLSNDFDNDLSTVKEYYVKGLVAEQRQLPFLLSYHSKCKTFLEQYFSSINRTFCNSEPHPLQPSLI